MPFDVIKHIYEKPQGGMMGHGESLNTFQLRLGTRESRLLSLFLCDAVLEVLPSSVGL